MAILNPYLNFNGNTEEAFIFYKSVFGGEFSTLVRFKDSSEKDKVAAGDRNKIMHVALPVGKENILMGTDSIESMGHKIKPGDNINLSISAQSEEEATRLFKGLSKGGKIAVPLDKASWGGYFGMLTDKFGIQWMVNYGSADVKQPKAEEREYSHN